MIDITCCDREKTARATVMRGVTSRLLTPRLVTVGHAGRLLHVRPPARLSPLARARAPVQARSVKMSRRPIKAGMWDFTSFCCVLPRTVYFYKHKLRPDSSLRCPCCLENQRAEQTLQRCSNHNTHRKTHWPVAPPPPRRPSCSALGRNSTKQLDSTSRLDCPVDQQRSRRSI